MSGHANRRRVVVSRSLIELSLRVPLSARVPLTRAVRTPVSTNSIESSIRIFPFRNAGVCFKFWCEYLFDCDRILKDVNLIQNEGKPVRTYCSYIASIRFCCN